MHSWQLVTSVMNAEVETQRGGIFVSLVAASNASMHSLRQEGAILSPPPCCLLCFSIPVSTSISTSSQRSRSRYVTSVPLGNVYTL